VRALFFDLDNTLVDDEASMRLAVERVCAELGAPWSGRAAAELTEVYMQVSIAFWATQPFVTNDLIATMRLKLWRAALARCGCHDEAVVERARDAYARHRMDACHVYPDSVEVLSRLAGRYRLAVITNGAGDMQRGRLRAARLDAYIDLVVASTDLDTGKPDPAIFRYALSKLDLPPDAVWHVGDRLDADVLGAHNAGLTSVWLNRRGETRRASEPEPHHEIASLTELIARLSL
jgi:putative hydrolase of the HAD superfamily